MCIFARLSSLAVVFRVRDPHARCCIAKHLHAHPRTADQAQVLVVDPGPRVVFVPEHLLQSALGAKRVPPPLQKPFAQIAHVLPP